MLRMVEDLLDHVQLETAGLRLEREPVDLVDLVRENILVNSMFAEEKDILLTASLPEGPLVIRVDPGKIEQVLNNLIGNALKFSLPGTKVSVRVVVHEESCEISILDEGPGIPASEQDRLFQPFSRLSPRPTGGEKSTGLGLAIVRRIVEGHGGRVWVENGPEVGSRFVVRLPTG